MKRSEAHKKAEEHWNTEPRTCSWDSLDTGQRELLAEMFLKQHYLGQASKQYEPMTDRERQILDSGWAACETHVGLTVLHLMKDEEQALTD